MDLKETPQLLSRLNEIVERSRLKRNKKALPNGKVRAEKSGVYQRFPVARASVSNRRGTVSGR